MASTSKRKGILQPIIDLVWWAWKRLERTLLLALKIVFPSRFISPLGFLGMLTTVVFIILGVTGALLMFQYQPTFVSANNSIKVITNDIAWGNIIRNVHYHASNAMVLLAVMHMFYQYFSGRYKLRYEMLWVTGVILGVVTVIEAYTGYDLIFNIRGQLAINIGQTLTYLTGASQYALGSQAIGTMLSHLVFGFSFEDLVIRFYALHVFIIPIAMLAIMAIHLPRNLVLDIPVSSAILGIIFIMGGLFPVEVGTPFVPGAQTEITFPEWYFTSLYAFIRVRGLDPFFAGAIIPGIFVIIFLIVPFFDRGKRIAMIDRPFWIALGVAALGQMAIVTVWGFRADNPFLPLENPGQLVIDPYLFFGSLLIASALAYGFVYAFIRWRRGRIEEMRAKRQPVPIRKVPPYILSKSETYSMLGGLLLVQGFMNMLVFNSILQKLPNFALLEIGIVLVAFAATFHIYRVASQAK